MKTTRITSLLVAALFGALLAGCAEETGYQSTIERKSVNGLPTVTATETAKSQARVEAIDYGNRSIALTGSTGKTEIFHVSSAVRNFNQIKKGDTVNVEYFSQILASVKKINEEPSLTVVDAMALAKLGDKPGIICARSAVIEANVVSIDLTTRVVVLKTVGGENMTFTADPKLKDLDKVHAGDQVTFNYTEAVAITVN